MTTIYDTVQAICLGMPETEEVISHGSPHFKAAGKGFAIYSHNHHGEGKVALMLNVGRETQQMLVESAPAIFYVPPYVGPAGWVAIELNKGLNWDRIARISCDAYCRVVPASLARSVSPVAVNPPTERLRPEDINPLLTKTNQAILKKIRGICNALPEVTEDRQFGNPSFKAGKKSFCVVSHHAGKVQLQFWVGVEQQAALTGFDSRFHVPGYIGHNGWINLDIGSRQDWPEITGLLRTSYEHFALKRMLTALAAS